jgi:hypothetical protein
VSERIIDKEKANFCDFYKWGPQAPEGPTLENQLKALEALFKK